MTYSGGVFENNKHTLSVEGGKVAADYGNKTIF